MGEDKSDWKAPHERDEFTIREERAPWGRWLLGLIVLGIVIAGALWLASKVVVPRDLPVAEKPTEEPEDTKPKIGADDAAWVKALEKDTLEGYREYLTAFPNGNTPTARRLKSTLMTTKLGAWRRTAILLQVMKIT